MTPHGKILILTELYDGSPLLGLTTSTFDPLALLSSSNDTYDIDYIYEDAFVNKKEDAQELLEELLLKLNQTNPLVFDIVEKVSSLSDSLVTVNASLLSDNDLEFLGGIYSGILFVTEVLDIHDNSTYVIANSLTTQVQVVTELKDIKDEMLKMSNQLIKEGIWI